MNPIPLRNLFAYFTERGWHPVNEDGTFVHFAPPQSIPFPDNFELLLPKSDDSSQYNNFVINTIEVLCQIAPLDYFNVDDLYRIFNGDSAILALRVCDTDTKDGSINFLNYGKQLEKMRELIKEAVGFSLTKKQFFVNTPKSISDEYLANCRGLQTAIGSFVTKLKMPYGGTMNFVGDSLDTNDVVSKLDATYDFVLRDIANTPVEKVDLSYLEQHKEVFSIQVVDRLQQLYSQSNINSYEFYISTIDFDRVYQSRNFLKSVKHLKAFTRRARKVLMSSTPLDARGKIIKLVSKNPEAAGGHKIIIRSELNNTVALINATVTREHYKQAIQAHEAVRTVHITGFAKEVATGFQVDRVDSFQIQ